MLGDVVDLFNKEVEIAIVVKDDYDLKLLIDVLDKYVKRYDIETSKIEDTKVTIVTLKTRQNKYRTMVRGLHDYNYSVVQISSTINIVKLMRMQK
ncbi:MAG: hypothetical protein EUB_03395 [Eubacterium sp.]|uniref:hypothetical protein n=1 Tax=Eubacterium sp. TaxID=142586 RepID=UPI00303B2C57